MTFLQILGVVVALHLILLTELNWKEVPRKPLSSSTIEVSLLTLSPAVNAPSKTENASLPEMKPINDMTPVKKEPEKEKVIKTESIAKKVDSKLQNKKEVDQPLPKIMTVKKSEVTVEKAVKSTKAIKTETAKKEDSPQESPHLSLESLQQQISQIGSEIRQQPASIRDKYIDSFSTKVKRIGQDIYERGTLPAGVLETKIEINANGSLNNFKITRSSGSKKLDEAVENMIRSSAPYPELPFQLLNETNTLTFTRVWEFYGD